MTFLPRILSKQIKEALIKFPAVAVLGPRQSGKTTLLRNILPDFTYLNLEDPEIRLFAQTDPKGFFSNYQGDLVLDEAQRVPEIFSYIQLETDNPNNRRKFVLSGSQNFLLHQEITQSLAGRIALFTLLPYSIDEIKQSKINLIDPKKSIYDGFYPRVISDKIEAGLWYKNYITTYIEKDVRNIKNINDLDTFQAFLKICAGNIGQILNHAQIGNHLGISPNTVKDWLSILEASYIIFRLKPYFINIKKRLIKSPKLYFFDTGLASYLLGLKSPEDVFNYYQYGNLFENLVVSDLYKKFVNQGQSPEIFYFRDEAGHELDILIPQIEGVTIGEIKSSQTFKSDFLKNIDYWKTQKLEIKHSLVIYSGSESQKRTDFELVSWGNVGEMENI
jgi:predicted AAA+ superfamily ATPase